MLNAPQALNRDQIARRIPHQGSMCLLDAVLAWDEEHISCEATSHLAPQNPLRAHGRLGAACGVEYAAQAMAMHGALVGESAADGTPPRAGYLAGVRGVTLQVDRLDDVAGPIAVKAQRITGDANAVLYSFSLQSGARTLVTGRAMVVLDASALGAGRAAQ